MANTFLEPAEDHVLVLDIERTETIDGIELPDSIKQRDMVYGRVVAVGPDARDRVKDQEIVCYGPYAGKCVVLEGIEFRIIRRGQIEAWVRASRPEEVLPF